MHKTRKLVATLLLMLALGGCASMSLDHPKAPSMALSNTANTHLAKESAIWRDGQLQGNGFYSLSNGKDAFGARLVLMDRAEKSIDAQYFLMKPDNAGLVFTNKLMAAADRGIRVRLLLDDVFTTVDDAYFSFMNAHPNVEVRIFNPVSRKGLYFLNYIGNFSLANRRMHNKSFIVDNQAAIVGGRNIAVEYFQLETTGEFIDFDMFAAGPIVKDVSESFDTYWNNELAVPMEAISGKADQTRIKQDEMAVKQLMKMAGDSIYADAINSSLMRQFSADEIDPYMANARVIVDDPSKLRAEISDEHQIVATEMAEVLNQAKQEVIIFTPYFIPGKSGIEFVRKLRDKGVRIVVITNSLASNNHTAVHSAYASYRKDLLKAGVELWEARADASTITVEHDDTTLTTPLTLHTKGILIDRNKVFVGSLNLDPRSIDINTEMGMLIESEPLVSEMVNSIMVAIPKIAYRLQLDDQDKISWHANIDGREVIETKEPLTSMWQRFTAWFLKIAPEQQL
ncbi:MAG: phospholipase D family protein [Pseudomonadota bacterium]|nr:phospholipase D family protein [Pseudomonadota bacterium]